MAITYQWREGIPAAMISIIVHSLHLVKVQDKHLPRQESHHKTKPGECENSTIFVDRVEDGDGARLPVHWVDLWCLPKESHVKTHDRCIYLDVWSERFIRCSQCRIAMETTKLEIGVSREQRDRIYLRGEDMRVSELYTHG